ncbi:MAG: hypothetical protein IIA61_00150 [Candidatus Marinimicrobia bacterium]|nr:hypothetical protein [Candidatus Neomarinimicrobiota bacterium]MCH8010357.1 hypothetical protein [Candidatus Neomarinimicrobiota bacterium]
MDTFSHTLWGYGLFGYRGRPWIAVIFGAMPDLVSFGPFLVIRILSGTIEPGPPPLEIIPGWVSMNYNFSHSFVIAFLSIGIVAIFSKSIAFAMLGWLFHILLDFPFHTLDYFPVKIFWPLSSFVVDGISWGQPLVWLPNLAGITMLFVCRHFQKKNTR